MCDETKHGASGSSSGSSGIGRPTPPLLRFMNGVYDRIVAAFGGVQAASAATRGSVREAAIAEIGASLPAVAKLCPGDIIDSFGAHTGQLDAIVVHANSPAVALAGEDRIVLAEGAVGVLEVKSDLRSQWQEVLVTWDKLKQVRRPPSRSTKMASALLDLARVVRTLSVRQSPDVTTQERAATLGLHEQGVVFVVVGWKGWAKHTTLAEKATELHQSFGKGPRPPLVVAQLDPPGCGMIVPTGNKSTDTDGDTLYEYQTVAFVNQEPEFRGFALFTIWSMLTDLVRNASMIDIDWKGYLGLPAGLSVEQSKTNSRDNDGPREAG